MRQIALKRLGLGVLFGAMLIGLRSAPAWGVNSVVVVSDTVDAGQVRCSVYVKITNDVALTNVEFPFTIVEGTAGCFPDSVLLKRNDRLLTYLKPIDIIEQKQDLVGTCKSNQPGGYTGLSKYQFPGQPDTLVGMTAPNEGLLYAVGRFISALDDLPAGADMTGSFLIILRTPTSQGTFEIDTTCISPGSHLKFVATVPITPVFTKGVITVACEKGLPAPSGPTPTDAAQGQLDSVVLRWGPGTDSCGVPVSSYYVLIGNSCSGLDPVVACTCTVADSCKVTGLNSNTDYFWKVRLTDFMGRQIYGPCWTFKTGSNAVQYLGGDGIPRAYSLDQNYPNPFNASTVIKFNTRHDGHVRLDVYNILGQKVRTLVDEFRHFGPQAADWDGTDVVGKSVPTGLYFYRLVTSDFTSVKKMVLLK